MSKHSVIVVGGGIIGSLTAYFLAQHGANVTVVEQNSEVASECSHANGGQISVCNAPVWNRWSNVRKGLMWLLKPDAPLALRLFDDFTVEKVRWLYNFLKVTASGQADENTAKTVALGLRSRSLYEGILAAHKLSINRETAGLLNIYRSKHELIAGFNVGGMEGLHRTLLAGERAVLDVEPMLGRAPGIIGGIHSPDDWSGDAALFCKGLQLVNEQLGVQYLFDSLVESDVFDVCGKKHVRRITDRAADWLAADDIVFCNGYLLQRVAKHHGIDLNLYPVKGYSITIQAPRSDLPKCSILDDAKKIVCSTFGDSLRVAGTAELAGNDDLVRYARIKPLLRWVSETFPHLGHGGYTSWACLRPMMHDMLPVAKQAAPGIWLHGGHGHLGWTLGAATSHALAGKILNK